MDENRYCGRATERRRDDGSAYFVVELNMEEFEQKRVVREFQRRNGETCKVCDLIVAPIKEPKEWMTHSVKVGKPMEERREPAQPREQPPAQPSPEDDNLPF